MNTSIILMFLALLAGALIPFQSAMNASLGKSLQSPYYASLIVFIIAAFGITCYIIFTKQPLPNWELISIAPKWSYLGGVLGGIYVLLIVLLAPHLGIGNVTVMVLLGQVIAAMFIDHFGALGASIHVLNWKRLVGVILMMIGIYLVKKF